MGHTAVSATEASSVTLKIWQRDKEKYCNFASFNRVVDTKTSKSKWDQIYHQENMSV